MHLRQQDVGSIVLSVGDSNLDGIAQRQHAPPLGCALGRDVQAMLAAALREISKEGLHYVMRSVSVVGANDRLAETDTVSGWCAVTTAFDDRSTVSATI